MLNAMKLRLLLMLLIFASFVSCKKDDSDYRDKFVGAYQCQITGSISSINDYLILIGSDKISYWKYAEGYEWRDPDTALVSYREEYKTIIDTIYVTTKGDSSIRLQAANYKSIGWWPDRWMRGHILSIVDHGYNIRISEDGHFAGGYEKDMPVEVDSVRGYISNDSLKLYYTYNSGFLTITAYSENTIHYGRKIK